MQQFVITQLAGLSLVNSLKVDVVLPELQVLIFDMSHQRVCYEEDIDRFTDLDCGLQ